jgi:hypothetical protein
MFLIHKPYWFLERVLAPFFAASERSDFPRLPAAERPCRESAALDAAPCPSRLRALVVARDRFGFGFPTDAPFSESCFTFFRVSSETEPAFGAFSFTPARRAFESPIAIACFVDRAPCLPSRMWSISSLTNSPAWVDGALPSRFARLARFKVFCSGMVL